MARIEIVEDRAEGSPRQREAYDHIAASRGVVARPFAALLHRPELAMATADLGAVIRFEGILPDPVRELVICTVAIERDCRFEWESHAPLAAAAGVPGATLEAVEERAEVDDPEERRLVGFTRELCHDGTVSDATFAAMLEALGAAGVVELTTLVGYYTMLAMLMRTCDVC